MAGNIMIGQFIPGNSIIHKSDPRTKIFLMVLFMVAVFLMQNIISYIALLVFVLVIFIISSIPLLQAIKGLKPMLYIIIFTLIVNLFFYSGTTILFQFEFVRITLEGLIISIKMTLRLFLIIEAASLLTFTTSPIVLTDGMEKLLNPLRKIKVPAHEIAMMMSIALRFIPTLIEETEKIIKAQKSRGADFDSGNIIRRAKSYIPVLVPLFISAFRRANDLALAMESRCYRGGEGRTKLKQLKFCSSDYVVAIVGILIIVAIFIADKITLY
jgi:energy-coupling factor transport system permease protein